jgi:hypothetical protein
MFLPVHTQLNVKKKSSSATYFKITHGDQCTYEYVPPDTAVVWLRSHVKPSPLDYHIWRRVFEPVGSLLPAYGDEY